ncbi:MAG: protein phosphatase 2C domain-containing protein [Clostridiales Family XIII bacterium]|nr:protein phosphatase 2C domain-containing protein [Clostridiales Family XIII bacterium]
MNRQSKQAERAESFAPASFAYDDSNAITQSFMDDDNSFAVVFTGSDTHVGTRDYQEDALFVTEAATSQGNAPIRAFGIVCDGMGGLENGDKASRLAADLMAGVFDSIRSEEGVEARLVEEVHNIDTRVRSECRPESGGNTGTTLVAALILGNRLHWVGVGDSRIYILRSGEIVQVTKDHTYMLELMKKAEEGLISPEEAEAHPQKGALISFIGCGNIQHINTNKAGLDLLHGDVVLLCSDGLTKSLPDQRIAEIVKTYYGDMKEAAQQLTLQSFDSSDGPKDNTSVVLMQYLE